MPCPRCRYENPSDAPTCNLCGALLREGRSVPAPPPMASPDPAAPPLIFSPPAPRAASSFIPPPPDEPRWKTRLRSPWTAMAVGLVAFPAAKALFIPNYVFNFLTTLVHECGHALFAWAVGRPSIPSVSIAGGGFTGWSEEPMILVQLAWMALMGWGIHVFRTHRFRRNALIAALALYPFLAFTRFNNILPSAGGILLEIGGAAGCFFTVFYVPLQRPFERPIYALWGWWMILNRGAETVLMLRSRAYWQSQAIIDSGLAAGLTSDLEVLRVQLGGSQYGVLWIVMILCLAAMPAAWGAAHLVRMWDAPEGDAGPSGPA